VRSRPAAVVVLLVLVALALRLPLFGDALFGDEIYTFDLVDRDSLVRTLSLAHQTEGTPPLFYALAWLTHWIGDATVSVRLPSLVFGLATVPVTYLLGRRVAGPFAGVVAAALVALSPFHAYYSTEARAYAVAGFFVALALLAVVSARPGDRHWWVVLFVAVTGAAYSHYTAGLPIAAALVWAFVARPELRRPLLVTVGLAALAYLPWLPFVSGSGAPAAIAAVTDFTPKSVASDLARALVGHPYRPIADLPGRVALIAGGLALLVPAAAGLRAAWSGPDRLLAAAARGPAGLVGAAALAAPLGVAVASLVGDDIFIARNLFVSVVPACVALAALWGRTGRAGQVAAGVAIAVMAYSGVAALGHDSRRVPSDEAAASVESFSGRADPVVYVVLLPVADFLGRDPQVRSVAIHLDSWRAVREARNSPDSIRRAAGRAPRFSVVIPGLPKFPPVPAPALPGYEVTRHTVHPGLAPVSVFLYERSRGP
jgi:hypothetical protein